MKQKSGFVANDTLISFSKHFSLRLVQDVAKRLFRNYVVYMVLETFFRKIGKQHVINFFRCRHNFVLLAQNLHSAVATSFRTVLRECMEHVRKRLAVHARKTIIKTASCVLEI